MSVTALDKWYGYMESDNRTALWDLLHPDAVFESSCRSRGAVPA